MKSHSKNNKSKNCTKWKQQQSGQLNSGKLYKLLRKTSLWCCWFRMLLCSVPVRAANRQWARTTGVQRSYVNSIRRCKLLFEMDAPAPLRGIIAATFIPRTISLSPVKSSLTERTREDGTFVTFIVCRCGCVCVSPLHRNSTAECQQVAVSFRSTSIIRAATLSAWDWTEKVPGAVLMFESDCTVVRTSPEITHLFTPNRLLKPQTSWEIVSVNTMESLVSRRWAARLMG